MKRIAIFCVIMILCTILCSCETPEKVEELSYEKITEIVAEDEQKNKGYYFANVDLPILIPVLDEKGNPVLDGKGTPLTKNAKYLDICNAYFFEGFDFSEYYSWHPSLSEINEVQLKAIKEGRKEEKKGISPAQASYSIMGYSQGGLTALGYLSALEREYPSQTYREEYPKNGVNIDTILAPIDKIDAVITISGAIKGAKILDNNLYIKGHQKLGILVRGFGASRNALASHGPFIFLADVGISSFSMASLLDFVMAVIPLTHHVWYDPSLKNAHQLRDMKPGSDYIKENVLITETFGYLEKTGKKIWTTKWDYKKVGKMKIGYLNRYQVDEKIPKTKTEVIPQFDPNVPVGFIVGTENRTLTMAEKEIKNDNVAYKIIDGCKIVFAVAEGIHVAKCVSLIGLLTGSNMYAADADRARKLCKNIDKEIAEIIGADEGDGFIPLANQYIPASFVDPNTGEKRVNNYILLSDPDGDDYIKLKKKENHSSIERSIEAYGLAAKMAVDGYIIRQKQGLRQ